MELDLPLPTAVAMGWLVGAAAKAAVPLATAWVVDVGLPRATPATRHRLWALGVVAALLVPVLAWSLPALPVAGPIRSTVPAMLSAAVLSPASFVGAQPAGLPPPPPPSWPAVVAIGWAAGAGVVGVRILRAHRAAWRLAAGSWLAPGWRPALAEAAALVGVSAELRVSGSIASPMTVGVVRPWVLVPVDAEDWPPERIRAILVHELGHVRRRDALVQAMAQAATCVYWWNPLAWVAARRLRVEREHACDDLVIAAGVRPSSYAADLLEVARVVGARALPAPDAALGAVEPTATEARLRRVLDPSASRGRPSRLLGVAAAASAVALTATLAAASGRTEPKRPAVPIPVCGRPGDADPAARSAVDLGGPLATDDRLDVAAVAREVAAGLGDVGACFPADAPDGAVVVHWSVDLWGNAEEACVTRDTLGDAAATACVNDAIARGSFPGLRGRSVEVALPLPR